MRNRRGRKFGKKRCPLFYHLGADRSLLAEHGFDAARARLLGVVLGAAFLTPGNTAGNCRAIFTSSSASTASSLAVANELAGVFLSIRVAPFQRFDT